MDKRYLNINEVSDYTGISTDTLYSWIWLKKIPHVKFGRMVRFDFNELQEWIQKQRVEAKQ